MTEQPEKGRSSKLGRFILPLAALGCVLALWQGAVAHWQIAPYVLPSPLLVAQQAWEHRGELALGTWNTAAAALGGFGMSLVLGVLIAILFSQSALVRTAFYPYAIFFQTVPIVAIAPLLIRWIMSDYWRVATVALVISIFPIITATTTGLIKVDASLLELFRLYRATRWQTLWKLRIPGAVPFLLTGARTSCGLSVVGAIVGETYAGSQLTSQGLGYLILTTAGQLKTDYLLAAILCSTLLGVAIFSLVTLVGNTLLARWYHGARTDD